MKKYTVIGNNLNLEMAENKFKLKIVGVNNIMKIEKNYGNVMMIGNNCVLDVIDNKGNVEVIGGNAVINMNNGGTKPNRDKFNANSKKIDAPNKSVFRMNTK